MKSSQEEDIITTQVEIDRFEAGKAVVFTERDEEIIVPSKLLPKSTQEGDLLFLSFKTVESETEQRQKKAKEILNEILNI
jgi:hypothetical protein